jgi:hypothetical protein
MYNPGRRGLVRLCRRSSAHHLATMQRKRLRASECPSWAPGSRAVLRASVSPLTVTCPRNRQLSQLLNLLSRDAYVACQNRFARATAWRAPQLTIPHTSTALAAYANRRIHNAPHRLPVLAQFRARSALDTTLEIWHRLRYLAQCPDCQTEIQKPLNCFTEPGSSCKG